MDESNQQPFVIDDRDLDLPGWSPVCGRCRHRISKARRACAAFPDGIPSRIWCGEHDHRTPFRGDRGILFAPLGPADVDTLRAVVSGDALPDGLSIAQLTERRRRVAS